MSWFIIILVKMKIIIFDRSEPRQIFFISLIQKQRYIFLKFK
jgi:hypothetical protein